MDDDDELCDNVTEFLQLLLNPVAITAVDDDGAKLAEDTDNAVPVELPLLFLLLLLLPLVDEFDLLLYWLLIAISLSVLPPLRAPPLPRFRTVRLYKHLFNLTGSVPTGSAATGDEFCRFMFLLELAAPATTSRGIPLDPTK